MKSNKSSLSKAVKAVAKSITKGTAAAAGKLKLGAKTGAKSASSAPTPPEAAEPPLQMPRTKRKVAAKKAPLEVPPILLEGDQPSAATPSGPGQKFSLGPVPPARAAGVEAGELPEAYGTKHLLLAARDPHWLYASWDLTRMQQREYNSASTDGHLVVKVYKNEAKGEPVNQTHVHPESTHWFIHVGEAGVKYVAELGYYAAGGKWKSVSISSATLTPPDNLSADTSAEFATIPMEIPFGQLLGMAGEAVRQHVPLAEIIQQLRAAGITAFGGKGGAAPGRWTPEQERALASIISMDNMRRVWMGSLEITELIRRQFQSEMFSLAASQFSIPTSPGMALSSISSPFGGMGQQRGFWFNVNAELIIYGATEPDATVTIGGRTIKLRGDGTFSYRFSLPDGEYELPAVAVSSDKAEARAAELKFNRSTQYRGEVGAHPQDPKLKPPLVAHV